MNLGLFGWHRVSLQLWLQKLLFRGKGGLAKHAPKRLPVQILSSSDDKEGSSFRDLVACMKAIEKVMPEEAEEEDIM